MTTDESAGERAYGERGRERPLLTLELTPAEWTVEDIEKLPHDGNRYELHEGSLVIMSPAIIWHSRVAGRLVWLFEQSGRIATHEVGIKFGDRSTRIADVAAFAGEPDDRRAHHPPSAIAVAVEIVSPESEDRDVGSKPAKYAAAGIPEYWLVRFPADDNVKDADITRFTLADGRYQAVGQYKLSDLEKTGLPAD
ncbi:MAG: Uma2 family endonuclease [Hamadaea sp.]|uniref:Uma2 family endonuclease n=1 Tax=Hamadaea sp. TaxID=2024425 RepID=UPI00179879F8|nr:Uma2 family endonuclease [Hamadaea sp.]NUR69416.1 Uma2 family endonuclease [Hamadaea sp.]NUT23831.1 Uma2 family endonuclease [Hamadaea sp.]